MASPGKGPTSRLRGDKHTAGMECPSLSLKTGMPLEDIAIAVTCNKLESEKRNNTRDEIALRAVR